MALIISSFYTSWVTMYQVYSFFIKQQEEENHREQNEWREKERILTCLDDADPTDR